MPRSTSRLAVSLTVLLGLILLSASVTPPVIARAPGNDKFGNAAKIGALPYHFVESTRRAKTSVSDPATCTQTGRTVWFTLKRGVTTPITADTLGSNFDTVLAAYVQTGSGTGGLVEIACNDDIQIGVNKQSQIGFNALADQRYYLMVGSYHDDAGGRLKLNVVEQ